MVISVGAIWTSSSKVLRCPLKMDVYTLWRVLVVGNTKLMTVNIDMKRGSTSFLPPPATPIAAKYEMSFSIFQLRSLPKNQINYSLLWK